MLASLLQLHAGIGGEELGVVSVRLQQLQHLERVLWHVTCEASQECAVEYLTAFDQVTAATFLPTYRQTSVLVVLTASS